MLLQGLRARRDRDRASAFHAAPGQPARAPPRTKVMSDRVFELLRTLEDRDLEAGLRDAASHAGLTALDDEDLRHLVRVLTSTALLVTSLSDLIKLGEVLDSQEPSLLRLLEGNP